MRYTHLNRRVDSGNFNRRGERQHIRGVAFIIGDECWPLYLTLGVNRHHQNRVWCHQRTEKLLHIVVDKSHFRAVVTGRVHNPLHLGALNIAFVVGTRIYRNQIKVGVAQEIHENLDGGFAQNQLVIVGVFTHVALRNILCRREYA